MNRVVYIWPQISIMRCIFLAGRILFLIIVKKSISLLVHSFVLLSTFPLLNHRVALILELSNLVVK